MKPSNKGFIYRKEKILQKEEKKQRKFEKPDWSMESVSQYEAADGCVVDGKFRQETDTSFKDGGRSDTAETCVRRSQNITDGKQHATGSGRQCCDWNVTSAHTWWSDVTRGVLRAHERRHFIV